VLFWYYSDIDLVISLLFFHCLLNIYVLHTILYLEYCKWYQSTFLDKKLWVIFFQGRDVFDVLKLQRYVVQCINLWSGKHTQELQVVLKCTLLATLVTLVGTPSSGSASDNTCIWIDLDILKPSIDKPINRLTAIVPPRKTLGKILSSTWVVG
jgi:hypothetical protein